MRFIREVCRPTHLVLSDPLIRTYVDFNMTFLHEMYKIGACYIDDHSLEELPFGDAHFDLAVMINVLDHVRDARLCMRNLIRIVRPGGYVVIGQDLTDSDDLARQPEGLKVGHPVTLDEKWFEPYLTQNFEQVLYRLMPRDAGWAPEWHYGTLIYIGKKVNDVRSEHDDNRDQ
jgi:ubiquinone/menaquinone biosynthesis C-methylase UbiE